MSGLRAPVQWEGVANTTTTQNTEQVNLEIESRKERDKLEELLRKEQERKTNDCKVKELKTVLELGGIRKIMSDSEYLSILTSDNRREKLLDLIKPVRELESHYLGFSSYYYNQETNTIFEFEYLTKEIRLVNDEVDMTLRKLNKL